jgi:ribosome-binding protein aMBF1 (putative translation factor)
MPLLFTASQLGLGSGPSLQPAEQHMNCLVCGAKAELTDVTIDGVSIACPKCGEYGVSSLDIASGQMERLEPEQRLAALDEAKRAAQPGARPVITTHLLA